MLNTWYYSSGLCLTREGAGAGHLPIMVRCVPVWLSMDALNSKPVEVTVLSQQSKNCQRRNCMPTQRTDLLNSGLSIVI